MIVRRKQFKRAREYRRRAAKRRPLGRLYRITFSKMREALQLITPEMAWFKNLTAPSGSTTTPVTAKAAVLVHYGDVGGAPSLAGR